MKLFLFLFSVLCFGQNEPLILKINSITSSDSLVTRRVYQINYQIKNNTNNEVQFFLNPTSFTAQAASSLTLFTVYKIYRNGIYESMDGPFYEKMYTEQDEIQDIQDYYSPQGAAFVLKIKEKYDKLKK